MVDSMSDGGLDLIFQAGPQAHTHKTLDTISSRASPHGRSQLNHQKFRVDGCMEEVLEWFNYPRARTHPWRKVGCQEVPYWPAL